MRISWTLRRPVLASRMRMTCLALASMAWTCLVGPALARAQGEFHVHAILSENVAQHAAALEGFRRGVAEAGIALVLKETRIGPAKTAEMAIDEVKGSSPDLVLAIGSEAARAAKGLARERPVVFTMLFHARDQGLLDPDEGAPAPAQAMTGVEMTVDYTRQIETLKTIDPGLKKVGVLYDPKKTSGAVAELAEAAAKAGVDLEAVSVGSREEIPDRLRHALDGVGAFIGIPDTTVFDQAIGRWVVEAVLTRGIPFLVFSPNFVQAGALIALYPEYTVLGRQTADLALRTWRRGDGPTPPVERAKEVRIAVNRRVADLIGVRLPEPLFKGAEHVYPE